MIRCAVSLALLAPLALAQTTAITGALVIDGTGAPPRAATVVIRGDRIESVGGEVPAGARVVQAEGLTLIPGLFDLHTHLPYSAAADAPNDWGKNLKAYLLCGVTSVVDFGTYPETFEPMRRLIRDGVVAGPRIHLAARMTTPGGHGAEGGRGDFFSLEVITPREARAAVRRVLPYKPDAIKVFTDGWRYGAAPDMTSMEEGTLAVIVEEAHKAGVEVLTHTVTLAKAKIAARAGVDVIAHGVGDDAADEELIALMKSRRTTYAPTMAVYEPADRRPRPPLLATLLDPVARRVLDRPRPPRPSDDDPRARRWRFLLGNVAALRRGGVSFGAGTDAGVTGAFHGWSTLRELQLLVEGGLTPLEAITAATSAAARAIRVDADRGTIAAGKLADLALVAGKPHENIADIVNVRRVFLGGRELDRDALAAAIATAELTPIPPRTVAALVDDMEGERTKLDTLRVNSTDSGHDKSRMTFGRTLRGPGNHALSIQAYMSEKARPFATMHLPLTRGAVEPADLTPYRGVTFEARGEGEYTLRLAGRSSRDAHGAPFRAGAAWRAVRVPFASLKPEPPAPEKAFDPRAVTALSFVLARPARSFVWLEIDNVRFY
jgi:imidazolonepropionase-like amidohydrolase